MFALFLAMLVLAPQSLDAARKKTISKEVKEVKREAPLEEWEKDLCVVLESGLSHVPRADKGTSEDASKCRSAIAQEEEHFKEMDAVKVGSRSSHATFDARCNAYKKEKSRIERELKENVPPTHNIRDSVDFCEPEVLNVCKVDLCPTMCFIKGVKDCDCDSICEETKDKLWSTGSMDCEDKKFADCQAELQESLVADGRYPELEALMREHTLKCVCVSWRTDATRDICYGGGKGIKPGTKWCQFTDTPSWTTMLNNAPKDSDLSALPVPECSEFPGKEPELGAAVQCHCPGAKSWATPNSPLGFGIVASVLWLATISF